MKQRQRGPEAVCALAEESGMYFVVTAIHTGTQTCVCVILLQHSPVVAAGTSLIQEVLVITAHKQRLKEDSACAGGVILQETALYHMSLFP